MSNSTLATYIWKGPKTNCNARDHVIDTITIHHMAGNGTLEGCFKTLAYKADPGSVNYGIDSLGAIGVMIDENLRAWTTCDRPNDMRAVTIEVANDKPSDAGGWHVSDKALESLIALCADICKRNGKTKMIWCGSLAATNARTFASNEMRMTIHKWFVATGCPGPYLESKMMYIANEVTKRLSTKPKTLTYDVVKDTPIVTIKGIEPKGKTVVIGGRKTVCGVQYGRLAETKDEWISLKGAKNVSVKTDEKPKTYTYQTTADTPIVNLKGVQPKHQIVEIGGRKTVCNVQYGRLADTKDDWISLKDAVEVAS